MGDPERRRALIIACDTYADAKLSRLRSPAGDAQELARVLADPSIGHFVVDILSNEREYVLRRAVGGFFSNAVRDEVLLLHLACHGIKDEDGTLYFAASDTETGNLSSTALPAEFVNMQMGRSRSRRVVLFLDCCYSGAFARGMSHRGLSDDVQVSERFEGSGRVVLTASNSMEYAWEGDDVVGTGAGSVFTRAVVDGLEDGDADLDGDGEISIDELYEYIFSRVHRETPNQTPGKWSFDVAGDLFVARSTRGVRPAPLPNYIKDLINNPLPSARRTGVDTLRDLLIGDHPALALAAQEALQTLSGDDSRAVSTAATNALESAMGRTEIDEIPEEEEEGTAQAEEEGTAQREQERAVEGGGERTAQQEKVPTAQREKERTAEDQPGGRTAVGTGPRFKWSTMQRRAAMAIGGVIAVLVVAGVVLIGMDDRTSGDGTPTSDPTTGPSPPSAIDTSVTGFSSTTVQPWDFGAGCDFSFEDGVLRVSQDMDRSTFCRAGTVNDEFKSILDPEPLEPILDVRVATNLSLIEGVGKAGLRCRGSGNATAWSGYMASIDSDGAWMIEEYREGQLANGDGPNALPEGVPAGPDHHIELACVDEDDGFWIRFTVDDVVIVPWTIVEDALTGGQVGISLDNYGSDKVTVDFSDFRIFEP